ncbi:13089_t:CDS:2 [Entrophospora sp. SA101]|nr:13089_t:CDS:2 [Entrophospora sp. SA101]
MSSASALRKIALTQPNFKITSRLIMILIFSNEKVTRPHHAL